MHEKPENKDGDPPPGLQDVTVDAQASPPRKGAGEGGHERMRLE
jgi:hypothetical protein